MKIETIVRMLEIHHHCMNEFGEFLKDAKPKHFKVLGRILELFNQRRELMDDDLEEYAIRAAIESIAGDVPAGQADDEFKENARRFADAFGSAALRMYNENPSADDFRLTQKFLGRVGDGPDNSALELMRKLVAAEDAKAEAESLSNLAEALDTAEHADLTKMVKRLERLKIEDGGRYYCELGVWDHDDGTDDEVRLTEPEFFAALDAIKKVRAGAKAESAPPAEPSAADEEEGEVIPETTALEEKFQEFKKKNEGKPIKTTLMVWDPVQGVADEGLDLTEAEFTLIIDRLRRQRRGEEDPQDHLERVCKTLFSHPSK